MKGDGMMFKWKLHLSNGKSEYILSDTSDYKEMEKYLMKPSVTFEKAKIGYNSFVDKSLFNAEKIGLKTHVIVGWELLKD